MYFEDFIIVFVLFENGQLAEEYIRITYQLYIKSSLYYLASTFREFVK